MTSSRYRFADCTVPAALGLSLALTGCPPPPDVTADTGTDAPVDTGTDSGVVLDTGVDALVVDMGMVDVPVTDAAVDVPVDSGPSCPASPPEMRITSNEITCAAGESDKTTVSTDCRLKRNIVSRPYPIRINADEQI